MQGQQDLHCVIVVPKQFRPSYQVRIKRLVFLTNVIKHDRGSFSVRVQLSLTLFTVFPRGRQIWLKLSFEATLVSRILTKPGILLVISSCVSKVLLFTAHLPPTYFLLCQGGSDVLEGNLWYRSQECCKISKDSFVDIFTQICSFHIMLRPSIKIQHHWQDYVAEYQQLLPTNIVKTKETY